MDMIMYRVTLDTKRTGPQVVLQGFKKGEGLSRRIIVTVTSGSKTHPVSRETVASVYVTKEGAESPSVNACKIENGQIIYDVYPADIDVAGRVGMQLQLITATEDGANATLLLPEFYLEVQECDIENAVPVSEPTFTALENALAQALAVYNGRVESMELSPEGIFTITYGDGTQYQSDTIAQILPTLKGEKGDRGIQGPLGPTGPTGPQGIQGIVGATGPQGPQGIQGVKGDKGDKGERGDSGIITPISGFYALEVDEEGNVYVVYADGEEPPNIEIDEEGNVYVVVPDEGE